MANVNIEIPDDSVEFEELQFMVEQARVQDPTMTPSQYVTNILMGYLKNRVLNVYKAHASSQTTEVLKEKFGPLSEVRS